jgi:hypothetical protein
MKIQNKYIFKTIISVFLYFHKKKSHFCLALLLGSSTWVMPDLGTWVWQGICCFFLNNTAEVNKELLVRSHETIQHICTSILVLNKTIIFV